jgi:hypothetical protein
MPREVTWLDYSVAIFTMYLAFFHFRGTAIGIVLSIAALMLSIFIKKREDLDFK